MRLTAALRNGVRAFFSTSASLFSSLPSRTASSRFSVPAAPLLLLGLRRRALAVPLRFYFFTTPPPASGPTSTSFENDIACVVVPMGKLFVELQPHLEESRSVHERIRVVMMKMRAAIAVMQSDILLLYESIPVLSLKLAEWKR